MTTELLRSSAFGPLSCWDTGRYQCPGACGDHGAITGGDLEMALRLGSPQQRARVAEALRDVQAVVNQIQGGS